MQEGLFVTLGEFFVTVLPHKCLQCSRYNAELVQTELRVPEVYLPGCACVTHIATPATWRTQHTHNVSRTECASLLQLIPHHTMLHLL